MTAEHKRKISETHKRLGIKPPPCPWPKGKKHTEESKRKMSKAQRGRKHTDETKQKIREASKGRKYTEETKRKIGKASMGRQHTVETKEKMSAVHKGRKHTEETKRKMSDASRGKKRSEETRLKMSEAKRGEKHYLYGKHLPAETKRKMSEAHSGEKSHLWKGGISFEPYSVDWTETLRRSIRERDHYICQLCSRYGNTVHHIDYNKKNCDSDNLITLCGKCNTKVNHNREYWTKYFQQKRR